MEQHLKKCLKMKTQKNVKNKIKVLLKSLIWPILLGIGQLFVTWLLSFYYVTTRNISIEFSQTSEFQEQFQLFINEKVWVVLLFQLLILLPIFYFRYRKIESKKDVFDCKRGFLCFTMGGCFGIVLNIVLAKVFGSSYTKISYSLLCYQILMIGIIGPLLEEFAYRGIMKQELEKAFSEKAILWIVTVIFALSHQGISTIVYAFLMGILFYFLLEKGSLKYAMMGHIGANTVTLLLGQFTKGWSYYTLIPLCISLLLLPLLIYKMKNFDE